MENLKLKEELEESKQREKILEEQKRRNSLVDKSSFENVQKFQLEAAQKKIEDLELALKKKTEEVWCDLTINYCCFKVLLLARNLSK